MKPEGWIDRHNPIDYEPIAALIERLVVAKQPMGALYIGEAVWNNGTITEPGWVVWHDGVFVNPFEADYFFAGDFDLNRSRARLLQPEETLHIRYVGEQLNGGTTPEGVPLSVLVNALRTANKEMGAIEIVNAVWRDGSTKSYDWVIWHGGVYVNPFAAEFFLAVHLDEEKTTGRLLRPGESLHVKHSGARCTL
jgi:hypothetical protein